MIYSFFLDKGLITFKAIRRLHAPPSYSFSSTSKRSRTKIKGLLEYISHYGKQEMFYQDKRTNTTEKKLREISYQLVSSANFFTLSLSLPTTFFMLPSDTAPINRNENGVV